MTDRQILHITNVRDRLEAWMEFADISAGKLPYKLREQAENQRDNYRALINELDLVLMAERE